MSPLKTEAGYPRTDASSHHDLLTRKSLLKIESPNYRDLTNDLHVSLQTGDRLSTSLHHLDWLTGSAHTVSMSPSKEARRLTSSNYPHLGSSGSAHTVSPF